MFKSMDINQSIRIVYICQYKKKLIYQDVVKTTKQLSYLCGKQVLLIYSVEVFKTLLELFPVCTLLKFY
jgi:hypothetical protein